MIPAWQANKSKTTLPSSNEYAVCPLRLGLWKSLSSLELTIQARLALTLQHSSCLCLPSARTVDYGLIFRLSVFTGGWVWMLPKRMGTRDAGRIVRTQAPLQGVKRHSKTGLCDVDKKLESWRKLWKEARGQWVLDGSNSVVLDRRPFLHL